MKSLKSVQFWLWMIVLLGISLRLREFLAFRSLWLDEVALLLQIKRRSYEALFLNGVLGNQGAPAGYLLLSKLSLAQFSSLEIGARVVSLVSGIGTMIVSAWLVTRSFRDSMTRLVGLLLIATSPWLIYYTAEGKHYMQEVLVALVFVCASLRYQQGKLSLTLFGALGIVSVWFSHNAAVVLCACGTLHIARAVIARERTKVAMLLLVAGAWVLSFALHAATNMRALFGNRDLFNYWGHGLAPWRKGIPTVVAWLGDIWGRLMEYVFIPPRFQVSSDLSLLWWIDVWECGLFALVALGIVRMFRERSPLAPYVALILGVAFSLALLRLSPFSSRLVLYIMPFVLLSAASGLVWLLERARVRGPLLASLGVGLFLGVVGPSVATSTERLIKPFDRTDMKGALRYLAGARSPDDLVVMRRADATVAALYAKRDRSLGAPFLDPNWKIAKPRVMCTRLRKRLETIPERHIWIVGVLQAEELSRAVDQMERECLVVTQRVSGKGFFLARLHVRT